MSDDTVEEIANDLAKTRVVDDCQDGLLSFEGEGLKLNTEDDAKEIIDAIKDFNNLSVLKLEGNTLGVDAAKGIAKALESQPHLKRALWKDLFTGRLKQEIPKALNFLGSGLMLANAQLVELDLSDNAFGPIGVKGILDLIRSPTCYTLEELKLNNNGLGITGGKALAASLLDCHESSSKEGRPLSLKVFISGRNRLENIGARELAKVFKAVKTLEEIAMPQNGINHEGISYLAEAVTRNPNLKIINLNDNTFTVNGAVAMSKALSSTQKLKVLNFGDCLIRTDGAKAIADALHDGHHDLQELHLGHNEIRKEGGIAVANCLKNKSNIKSLDLNGNQFGEEGIQQINETLENIGKLETLTSNDFDSDEGDESDDNKSDGSDDDKSEEDNDVSNDDIENCSPLGLANQKSPQKATAAEFLASPSPEKFVGLGNNRLSLILEELGDDVSCEKYVDTFMKISSVVQTQNDEMCTDAFDTGGVLMRKAFELAKEQNELSILCNTILVHFGLIKSENKDFKVMEKLNGPMIVLTEAVQQDYFANATREILQLFLSTPNKMDKESNSEKHHLLQVLYQH